MMQYQEAWTFLDNLQFFKIKLGLESMSQFLESVGNPHRALRFLHVAGTNGKGSVSTTLREILTRAGYRVGLYTSPHLSCVRERFRLDDRFISEEEFARQAGVIREVLGERQITYFEFATALALLWFAEEQVDVAILEVGMGGRLDATNVVTPLVSVITNVSMDHEQYLGNTLAAVAYEKAGVIKPGVPVVAGVSADESLAVVEEVCRERKAPLFLLGREFATLRGEEGGWEYRGIDSSHSLTGLQCRLKGGYQIGNAALALAALELVSGVLPVDGEAIRQGLLSVAWPGRLEYFCLADGKQVECPAESATDQTPTLRRYLLDGAHNPAGVESLLDALVSEFSYVRLILVWGCMADKDVAATLTAIAPLADRIIFTRPESERSATVAQLTAILPEEDRAKAQGAATVAESLAMAADLADSGDLICVAGSLYLVGAARKILLGEVAP
ncbi:bifunctional folylpolyglutamate synthase/dihydrofolate synthase [Thiovibrio frasassiensis]|uniref:Dihydrofolate synthase/folylpolyglutamate synthase n=1 Tax=Thiovibrio frasassiensis TaxID=2984131 RepID=A0A9X4MFQ4_9BACT|nr:folylpolyglutamate synthase/dihydrofolate synthase family protein [Thiovibrio frasassiensis]MDG4476416.1 bifunctional folylpolyglutamate synthase/dihydrofolate synthase [Thiovibrio frasassiensis]